MEQDRTDAAQEGSVDRRRDGPRDGRDETSVVQALVDVLDAGHRLILNRIDLARAEAAATVSRMLTSASLAAIGVLLLALGWCALSGVAVLLLRAWLPLSGALACVGLVNGVGGGIMLGVARRRARGGGAS